MSERQRAYRDALAAVARIPIEEQGGEYGRMLEHIMACIEGWQAIDRVRSARKLREDRAIAKAEGQS